MCGLVVALQEVMEMVQQEIALPQRTQKPIRLGGYKEHLYKFPWYGGSHLEA